MQEKTEENMKEKGEKLKGNGKLRLKGGKKQKGRNIFYKIVREE